MPSRTAGRRSAQSSRWWPQTPDAEFLVEFLQVDAFILTVARCLLRRMKALSNTPRRPTVFRLRDLRPESGPAPSTTWKLVKLGLWPPPIRLTGKSVGFLTAECDAVLASRIRGESDEAIRQLVRELVAARKAAGIEAA